MSAVRCCDGCYTPAPADYSPISPYKYGWVVLHGDRFFGDDYDACSWGCVATIVAAQIAEGAEV